MASRQFTEPVLILAFNRPDLTKTLVDAIRPLAPERVYATIDGPRVGVPDDADLVQRTREVIELGIDWPCELILKARQQNMGCRRGVVEAIDGFFENEARGVILEDDCIPHPDFFPYCQTLLERYESDTQVLSIGGDNSAGVSFSTSGSYGFVRHPAVWGWASWRRAWVLYDRDLSMWSRTRNSNLVSTLFSSRLEREYRTRIFNRLLDENIPDTWDYQWSATHYLHRGLSIMPARNLIRNLGFRPDATHTIASSPFADAETHAILPLTHPERVAHDRRAEWEVLTKVDGARSRKRLVLKRRPGWWRTPVRRTS